MNVVKDLRCLYVQRLSKPLLPAPGVGAQRRIRLSRCLVLVGLAAVARRALPLAALAPFERRNVRRP